MVIIGVALAVVSVFLVLHWWSEGMIDGAEAIVLGLVYGILSIGLFSASTLPMFLLAFIPLAAAIAYTSYSFRMFGLRSYLKSRCEEYSAAIRSDPSNRAAREYLARTLYSLGDLDRAVDELEIAVQMGADMEVQYTLNNWRNELQRRDSLNPWCKWCRIENPQSARRCVKCGSDLPYRNRVNHWLAGGRSGSSRIYLILTAGGALVAVSLATLPVRYAFIPVLLVAVALVGWGLISSARS